MTQNAIHFILNYFFCCRKELHLNLFLLSAIFCSWPVFQLDLWCIWNRMKRTITEVLKKLFWFSLYQVSTLCIYNKRYTLILPNYSNIYLGSWFYLVFFCGAIKLTGPFVVMIYAMIMGDMYTFSIIYIIFLFGFTQAFFYLIKSTEVSFRFTDLPHSGMVEGLKILGGGGVVMWWTLFAPSGLR